jgi:hypothetical protein
MRVQKYNIFPQLQSFFQEISSTDFILLINRALTNQKSDNLLMKANSRGLMGASSANAIISRSARRQTVRHTWHCEASMVPPGRMNACNGSNWWSAQSMAFSKWSTWASVMEQGGISPSCLHGMARCVPISNKRDCSHRRNSWLCEGRSSVSCWSLMSMLLSRPICALSSSIVP